LIFREGDTSSEMYVVLHGEFEVLKNSKRGVDTRVALLGTGDWFGEMSILDVQPRSASVRSLAVSRLLVITTADLEALYRRDVKSYSLFVLNVARELSRRLRVTDGILAELAASMVDDVVAKRHGSST
ncbi:MAG TPA: cyclic nucleotide-binding domain-containing protein, partial [Polyangiaceae bacterium]|nr:cyclic nucleotide-binding domain-containing protein [Polyangiaceae bacterium]